MADDLASIMIKNSVGSVRGVEPQCSGCGRMPLVGEWLYEFASGKRTCSLCAAATASEEGEPVGAERVRSCERRLAVVQQSAA
jgi:hypothetical protein